MLERLEEQQEMIVEMRSMIEYQVRSHIVVKDKKKLNCMTFGNNYLSGI